MPLGGGSDGSTAHCLEQAHMIIFFLNKNVNDTGLAIAQFQTIRLFGGLVGLTISSSIFNNVFPKTITHTTVQLTGVLAPLKDASNAVNFDGLGKSGTRMVTNR
ncbi:Major facilitator superfamily domain general substrate transporter [Penicillium robsamsonii]|uniref:Major facilitator superfamily domain general substrate transporter n=1 Tax=Penicillium robsamsonii TaxID=1792511 RepID=UPI002548A556|nr:Major facilitator superfamily domain general substrate transporter [Penicillium robsamsonii]KAJ5836741.1 Major facilitator superfamily domain general substrate transporter [Penicillium robsamsonii]